MIQRNGWILLFHRCLLDQLEKLEVAVQRAKAKDSVGYESNANVKLHLAISKLIFEVIPADPSREEYRQGNTLGEEYRHWRRAKIGRRFRLFFRFDTSSRVIVFAWINDENSLRSSGSKSDPYVVFQRMLDRGNPPNDWASLVSHCKK